MSLDATGGQTNAVTVTGIDVGDPDPSNNSDSVTGPADPTRGPEPVEDARGPRPGATAGWLLVVTNHGPRGPTSDRPLTFRVAAYSGATETDGANWTCTTTASGTVSQCRRNDAAGATLGLAHLDHVAGTPPPGPLQNRAMASAAERPRPPLWQE